MDAEQIAMRPETPSAERAPATEPGSAGARSVPPRPRTVRWFAIVGLLLALVLGALYGFNQFRAHAIATFFAEHKPPPVEISAATVKTISLPRFAPGIGSIAAIHQVTVNPEVGGRVTTIFFEPGELVHAGDPLVQLNDAPDRGDLANYQAQAHLAELSLQRAKMLRRSDFASQETVDQDQAQLDEAQAQILRTEAVIAQKLIRAPFAGQLGVRQIDLGQYLNPGAPIVTLTDLSMLYVNFTLPSHLRPEIHVGQRVDVTSDAYPGRTFVARLTTIEPQISPDTRTIQVQATMPNAENALLPGMFVDAAIVLPPRPDTMVLPETTVEYTLYGDSVYVIRAAGKDAQGHPVFEAVRAPVKTGRRWDGKVAILDGLKPGQRVVADGQIKVQSGARVAVVGAPPAPPAHPTLH
jgi:membrane fusion protein, multidrug efflux system